MDANGQIIDATTRDSRHIEGAIEKLLDEKIVLTKTILRDSLVMRKMTQKRLAQYA